MTRVHKNSILLKGEGGKFVDFVRIITYDAKAEKFSTTLPEWWSKILGYGTIFAETERELEVAWHEAQERFEELTTNKRKIIVYSFKSSAVLSATKKGELIAGFGEDFDHVVFRSDQHGDEHAMSFTDGTALDVWFNVGYETTSKFEEYKTYTDLEMSKIGDSRNKDLHVMEWTPEREDFFVNFRLELTKMIYKLEVFLNGSEQRMVKLIDEFKSVPALPFPKENEIEVK
jgi:hypothetical protein